MLFKIEFSMCVYFLVFVIHAFGNSKPRWIFHLPRAYRKHWSMCLDRLGGRDLYIFVWMRSGIDFNFRRHRKYLNKSNSIYIFDWHVYLNSIIPNSNKILHCAMIWDTLLSKQTEVKSLRLNVHCRRSYSRLETSPMPRGDQFTCFFWKWAGIAMLSHCSGLLSP